MGVVRREGDWRLEKIEEGVYEITFQREPQLKVLTEEQEPDMFGTTGFDMTPVREVNSYSEAVGLFEEKAHGPPPIGMDTGGGLIDTSSNPNSNNGGEDIDAPPVFIAIGLLLGGGLVIYTEGFVLGSLTFQIGVVFLLGGLLVIGWAGYLFRREGLSAATDFLFDYQLGRSRSRYSSNVEKTPPASQNLKQEIMFERANHHCEWCGERYDRLQVHHIEPRSEGGPNTKRNLIALCPTCHDKADHGGISKTQLKGKIRNIMGG